MRSVITVLLVISVAGASAAQQPLLGVMADELCDCMEAAPEIVYPRIQAQRCLEQIATRRTVQLREVLNLASKDDDDRRQLAELLIDSLTARCPLLYEFAKGRVEAELHYSDFSLARGVRGPKPASPPPADPSATTLREASSTAEITGKLAGLQRDNLQLRTDEGVITFYYRARELRGQELMVGQSITVGYRYDWQQDAGVVQRWVTYLQ